MEKLGTILNRRAFHFLRQGMHSWLVMESRSELRRCEPLAWRLKAVPQQETECFNVGLRGKPSQEEQPGPNL